MQPPRNYGNYFPVMRPRLALPLLFLGAVLCPGAALLAQQQESRIAKILNPDPTRVFDVDSGKTYGAKTFYSRPRAADPKAYNLPDRFNAKEYLTGGYQGQKGFWMGDFKYRANAANTTPRSELVIPKNREAGKSAPVKADRDAQKRYATGSVPTRDFRGKEREKLNTLFTPEQAANNGYRGDLQELKSIDDIRALLNKSK